MLAKKIVLLILALVGWLSNATRAQDSSSVKLPNDSTAWLNSDSVNAKLRKHSPTKATIYSLVIPGLGQAYNRQYWKIPVIYGIGALLVTQIVSNEHDYVQADRDYNTRVKNIRLNNPLYQAGSVDYITTTGNSYDHYDELNPSRKDNTNRLTSRILTLDQLRSTRDSYRRDRDFYVIVTALVYALNIVDATVFAHLREFEVSEKLSMKIDPQIRFAHGSTQPIAGISCSLRFK